MEKTVTVLDSRRASFVVSLWCHGVLPRWLLNLFGWEIYFRMDECDRMLKAIEQGRFWSLPALNAYLGRKMAEEDIRELERGRE